MILKLTRHEKDLLLALMMSSTSFVGEDLSGLSLTLSDEGWLVPEPTAHKMVEMLDVKKVVMDSLCVTVGSQVIRGTLNLPSFEEKLNA